MTLLLLLRMSLTILLTPKELTSYGEGGEARGKN